MEITRPVDVLADYLWREPRTSMTNDLIMQALDDLQRQIDELKEEAR